MTFRSYKVRLQFNESTTPPADLPKQFGVLISDPSNLVPQGTTKQRGLSFLNTEGIKLEHPALKHVPIMNKLPYPITEEDEITNIVNEKLEELYQLKRNFFTIHIIRA